MDRVLRVLIGCEESGVVREAFRALGHNAWSCDLKPTRIPGQHFQCDIFDLLARDKNWDIFIAHPPCDFLANSGVRWLYGPDGPNIDRWSDMTDAALFFNALLCALPTIPTGLENPIQHKYAREIIKENYNQIIHPWQFGHEEEKTTCLWLRDLPPLLPTDIKTVRYQKKYRLSALAGPGSSKNRKAERSVTYPGIAAAMASQWSAYVLSQRATI